jgi:hypothetical protein
MAELDDYGDKLIILRAVQNAPTRPPLQPTNKQVAVKPSLPIQQEMADSVKPQWSPDNAITRTEFLALRTPNDNNFSLNSPGDLLLAPNESFGAKPPVSMDSAPIGGARGAYISPYDPIKAERRSATPVDREPALPLKPQESPEELSEIEPVNEEDTVASGNAQLQALCANSSPETLERAVEGGLRFLDSLAGHFSEHAQKSPDSVQWLQQIGKHYSGIRWWKILY